MNLGQRARRTSNPLCTPAARAAAGALLALSAAGALASLDVLASAQPSDAAALPRMLSPDREQRLWTGARKESEVSVYTSLTSEEVLGLTAAFEKKYGVKVRSWRASSEKILQRTLTEARASRFDVDVIETYGPELEATSSS